MQIYPSVINKPHKITLQSIRIDWEALANWKYKFMKYASIRFAEAKTVQDVGEVNNKYIVKKIVNQKF